MNRDELKALSDDLMKAAQTAVKAGVLIDGTRAELETTMGRPRDIDLAWRSVNALGGTHPTPPDEYTRGKQDGYDEALDAALAVIERLGGSDCLTWEQVDKFLGRAPA